MRRRRGEHLLRRYRKFTVLTPRAACACCPWSRDALSPSGADLIPLLDLALAHADEARHEVTVTEQSRTAYGPLVDVAVTA